MQVIINAPHVTVPDAFATHIEEHLHAELAQFEGHVTRVEVHLKDLNGKKGGIDHRCLLEARPRGMDPLTADHESATMKDAFTAASEKLHRVLQRHIGRLSATRHTPRTDNP